MYTFSDNIDKNEYDNFVSNYQMASIMEEYNWCNVKDNWDNIHCALYKDNIIVGVCTILIKKVIKNIKLFYIPRGYLIDYENIEYLKEMTKNIKILAKKYHAYVVKIDPNFCISEKSFKDEEVAINYSKNHDIKNNNLISLGYINTGIHKELGKNLQPQYNVFAPIIDKNNKILTTEEILATYKSKFKYYLNGFHQKRGIKFEITNDIKNIDDFIKLLKITEKKQNINLRNKDYFIKILNNYKDRAFIFYGKMNLNEYMKYLIDNNGKEEEINTVKYLINEGNDIITLSTGLLILPYNKIGIRTSEYLYAGNSDMFTNLHISDGLVFEMIKFSMQNNCHYCNLGGVDGNLTDHLTVFKQKFNGIVMEFTGEYDLPISWIYYPVTKFYPLLLKIYKKVIRRK